MKDHLTVDEIVAVLRKSYPLGFLGPVGKRVAQWYRDVIGFAWALGIDSEEFFRRCRPLQGEVDTDGGE